MLIYKKDPKDSPLGNAKQASLIQWWTERADQTSPSNSPYNADNEEDDDDGVGKGDNDMIFFGEENGAVV